MLNAKSTDELSQLADGTLFRDSSLQASKVGAESIAKYIHAQHAQATLDEAAGLTESHAMTVLAAVLNAGFFDKQSEDFGMLTTYELLKDYVQWQYSVHGPEKMLKINTIRDYITGCVRWHTRGAIRCNHKYTPGSALHMLETAAKKWKEIDEEDRPHVSAETSPTTALTRETDTVPERPILSKDTEKLSNKLPQLSKMWKAFNDPRFQTFLKSSQQQFSEDLHKAEPITPQLLTELLMGIDYLSFAQLRLAVALLFGYSSVRRFSTLSKMRLSDIIEFPIAEDGVILVDTQHNDQLLLPAYDTSNRCLTVDKEWPTAKYNDALFFLQQRVYRMQLDKQELYGSKYQPLFLRLIEERDKHKPSKKPWAIFSSYCTRRGAMTQAMFSCVKDGTLDSLAWSKLLLFVGWVLTSKAARGYICKSFLQQIEMASVLYRDMGQQEPDMKTIRTRFEEQLGLVPGCPEDWDALRGCPLNDGQDGQAEEKQAKDVANDERAAEEQETKMDVEQKEETNEEQPTNEVKEGDNQGINKDKEMTSNKELAEEREASKEEADTDEEAVDKEREVDEQVMENEGVADEEAVNDEEREEEECSTQGHAQHRQVYHCVILRYLQKNGPCSQAHITVYHQYLWRAAHLSPDNNIRTLATSFTSATATKFVKHLDYHLRSRLDVSEDNIRLLLPLERGKPGSVAPKKPIRKSQILHMNMEQNETFFNACATYKQANGNLDAEKIRRVMEEEHGINMTTLQVTDRFRRSKKKQSTQSQSSTTSSTKTATSAAPTESHTLTKQATRPNKRRAMQTPSNE
ncbi:hypothetical protein QOT17_019430 [Balamuthia mandrillaris]